jgi:heptosyltransferase-2
MNRILIIGPSWVGDMVMSQSLFKVLKQNNPDCQIDVLAPAWSLPILARMPEVHKGIVLPFNHGELKIHQRYQLGKQLQGHYDQAIVLPNSLKSALIPFFAGIKQRTGWRGEMRYGLLNDVRVLDEKRYPLMVQRFIALGYPKHASLPENFPKPQLLTTTDSLQKVQQKYGLNKLLLNEQRKVLALCPGAEFGNSKQWPEEHYATVANQKIKDGWQVWILGSRNDGKTTEKIFSLVEKTNQKFCINLASRTDLVETIDIIALADAVITNDSGLMHIAAAVHTPLVVVYGSTSPQFTPPLNDKVKLIVSDISCAPCFKRRCRYGHRKCLVDQQPQTVLNNLESLLSA